MAMLSYDLFPSYIMADKLVGYNFWCFDCNARYTGSRLNDITPNNITPNDITPKDTMPNDITPNDTIPKDISPNAT